MNLIIRQSTEQLSSIKGLDILPTEKSFLKENFKQEKHHIVTAMNIVMFLQRHQIIAIEPGSEGKVFVWNEEAVEVLVRIDSPMIINHFNCTRYQDEMLRWKDWNSYIGLPDDEKPGSISKNRKYYLMKWFCDDYSLIKLLCEIPTFIAFASEKLEYIMKIKGRENRALVLKDFEMK